MVCTFERGRRGGLGAEGGKVPRSHRRWPRSAVSSLITSMIETSSVFARIVHLRMAPVHTSALCMLGEVVFDARCDKQERIESGQRAQWQENYHGTPCLFHLHPAVRLATLRRLPASEAHGQCFAPACKALPPPGLGQLSIIICRCVAVCILSLPFPSRNCGQRHRNILTGLGLKYCGVDGTT